MGGCTTSPRGTLETAREGRSGPQVDPGRCGGDQRKTGSRPRSRCNDSPAARFGQLDARTALDILREAHKIDPENVLQPWVTLAAFYAAVGGPINYKYAKNCCTHALKEAPDDQRVRLAAARFALDCGNVDEAKTLVEKALKIDAKSLDALILRGIVALLEKKYEAAETDFAAALQQSPDSYAACNNLALALCGQNDDGKKNGPWDMPRRTAGNIRTTRKRWRLADGPCTGSAKWTRRRGCCGRWPTRCI